MRLLATDLNGPGIARHPVLWLHSVRSHTKSIYTKRAMSDLRAAVTRAAELGILERPQH